MLQWTMGYMCFFQFWFPQDICPAVGFSRLYGNSTPRFFLRNLHTVLHIHCTSLHSTNSIRGFTVLHTPLAFIVCRLFDDAHSTWCEKRAHCGLDLYFFNNEWCWAFFHVFSSHLYVFFWRSICLGLLPTFQLSY